MTPRIASLTFILFAMTPGSGSLLAQSPPTAQELLWDGAVAGDTLAIAIALANGAKLDSLDTRVARNGRYALNWAALSDKPAAVRQLIARGAPIDASNRTGFTALHHAAEAGSVGSARELLAAGANPGEMNGEGWTPAQVARARGFESVAVVIDSAAGKQ